MEVDSSYSARDSYFCHNCENIESCIFCFNAKSMSYAICNTPVSREEYSRIKKMLLAYVNKELDEKNSLGLSIFNLSEFKDNRIGARV
ncbi:MAG: hypothetical protein NT157_06085 [Candidatus Micrarchaeota archaeon]|nr:hypothetical protein [Candidatus Micrarchaeota archaeon]